MTKTERQIAAAMSGLIAGKKVTWLFTKPANATAMCMRFLEILQKLRTGGFTYRRASTPDGLKHEITTGPGSVRFVTLTTPRKLEGLRPPIIYDNVIALTEERIRRLVERQTR